MQLCFACPAISGIESIMPRKARIDAPGALHHIICRGINRKRIFRDNTDRNNFVERLGNIIIDTSTSCYAWVLIPNHFHLLLRTGKVPIATVMRRLLTGYAVTFNRRHRRHGHLFQNRYKSILCQEEPYLLELVRYIHLNPVRAKVVSSYEELDTYPYSGHSRIMGRFTDAWQEADEILLRFSKRISIARRKYSSFVEEGVSQGRKPELTGGGLIRSAGGWQKFQELRKMQVVLKSDERILGENDFVDTVLEGAEEVLARSYQHRLKGYDFNMAVEKVGEIFQMHPKEILTGGKQPQRVQARSLLCYWAVRELGLSATSVAVRLGLTQPTVSRSVQRGEKLAFEQDYQLADS
jgi:putative transposase